MRPFHQQLASKRGGSVLELACGTGRLIIPLTLDGHEVVGLDSSPTMLAAARQKAQAAGARATWLQGDMPSFDLRRRFDLIIVSCNSLAHMLTSEALVGCLQLIGRQLEPWGTLALGVVNPNAKRLARPPADRFRRAHSSPEGVRVHERATYDPAGQVLEAVWRVQDDQGGVHPLEPLRLLRQTFPSEVRLPRIGGAGAGRAVRR
jgi:SAM-dependent methyltransferase